jgi:RecJ-like exonuclease
LKVVNITHGDDSDGLVCGALMRRLFDAEVMLANYDNLEEVLDGVDRQVGELYITDLNLRPALLDRIIRIRAWAPIRVIDHHPMAPKFRKELTRAGVELTLDTRDSAAVLVYSLFRDRLEPEASRLAAYAAISDLFDDGPVASRILDGMDRKFVEHEALILTHALAGNPSGEFKGLVLDSLTCYGYPHMIEGALEASRSHLDKVVRVRDVVRREAKVEGRVAYMECGDDLSTGEAANIVMDAMGVDVGLCYKVEDGLVNISLRGQRRLREHLGVLASRLSERHGGFGGGHNRASGAKVPKERIWAFIEDIVKSLSR